MTHLKKKRIRMDFSFSEIPGKVSSERIPTQYTDYY